MTPTSLAVSWSNVSVDDQVVLGSDHPFDMGEKDPVGRLKEAIDDPAVVSTDRRRDGGAAASLVT